MSTHTTNISLSSINSPTGKKDNNVSLSSPGSKKSRGGRIMDAPNEITVRTEIKIEDLIDEDTDYEEEEEEEEEDSTMGLFLDDSTGSMGNQNNIHLSRQNDESYIFGAFARVFFQGKNDRYATQVLPSNSSVQSRDSYLYVEVDTKKKKLSLFPDINEKVLLIKPPIQLKYFYAVKVSTTIHKALFYFYSILLYIIRCKVSKEEYRYNNQNG